MPRGALVGLGAVALRAHVPGWLGRRDTEIVAGADPRTERWAAARAALPAARWYGSAAELLAREDLDFVDICAPPSSHAGLIRAALERGLHVLCEKPLVPSLGDLTAVAGLASARNRVLHTVHNWHHAPIIRRTCGLLRDGAIGRVRRIAWQTLRTRPVAASAAATDNWRLDPDVAGGGVLTDHGWHAFYVLRRWVGQAPTSIRATLETRRHTQWPVEDTATLRVTFPGAIAEVFLSWASDVRQNRAEVTGTEGTIRLEDDLLVLRRRGAERAEQRWPCPPALSAGSYHADWFHPVAEQFVAALNGAASRDDNLAEAALCVALETAARESSRLGEQVLPVPAFGFGAAR